MNEPLADRHEVAGGLLLDAKAIQAELGVTRAAAEKIMTKLPSVIFEDLRKVYIRRTDLDALIEERTFTNNDVPV